MKTQTSVKNQSTVAAREHYTNGSVTSQDGTTIGYRHLGHGPGVVMLHGAMESAQSHMQLADVLADTLTIYLPDRRGLSGMNGSVPTAFVTRYDKAMAQGKLASALVTGMKGSQMGPPVFNAIPRWLLEL